MGNKMGLCSRRSGPPEEHPGPVIEKPEIPFKHVIPGGIFNGRLVRVRGYVKDELERFMIKLQCGYNDDANVALLIHLRSEDNFIVLNAIDKGITSEAIAAGPVPLHRGQPFEIYIICEPGFFQVIINDMFTCNFPHILPTDGIMYIAGDGDIRVSLISFETLKPRPSQVIMANSPQSPSPGTGVSNENPIQNGGFKPVYQYSRESRDPPSQMRLDSRSRSQHVMIREEGTSEPQRQDTPSNAEIAHTQKPSISSAPFVLSMAGNVPSTQDDNTNAPNSSGVTETDTNVQR